MGKASRRRLFRQKELFYHESINADNKFTYLWKWLPLAFVIIFVAIIRVRLLGFPLERDEGEYAYLGQLLLQGAPPYKLAYNMKFPGVYFMYAIIMTFFGQTSQGIHFGLLLLNLASIILVFLIARKIIDHTGAVIASAAYGVLSLSRYVLGFAGHATHFVVFFALTGFLILLKTFEQDKKQGYLWSGALFGLAFLMKQSAIFYYTFGVLIVLFNVFNSRPLSWKNLFLYPFIFLVGFLIPIMGTFIFLYTTGVFDRFWFWTFTYLAQYASGVPIDIALNIFKKNTHLVIDGFFLIWIFSTIGLIMAMFDKRLKSKRLLLITFTLFSFLTICPGFHFRKHYYITLLPAISILTGVFCYSLSSFIKNKHIAVTLFLISVFIGINNQKEYFFTAEMPKLSRVVYELNPFPEAIEIAKFINSRTNPNDTIGIMGSEPEIFFYSKRRSASGYIYTYSLMENHPYSLKMQKEMAEEIESKMPKIIIDVQISASWRRFEESEIYIFNWADNYISKSYTLVGVVDIYNNITIYKWGKDAENYRPGSLEHIYVYERMTLPPKTVPLP